MHLISSAMKNLQSRLDARGGRFGLRRSATDSSSHWLKTLSKKTFRIYTNHRRWNILWGLCEEHGPWASQKRIFCDLISIPTHLCSLSHVRSRFQITRLSRKASCHGTPVRHSRSLDRQESCTYWSLFGILLLYLLLDLAPPRNFRV